MRAAISWSGGKDSYLALHIAVSNGYVPTVLISMMNDLTDHSRSNGVNLEILKLQSKSLNIPIIFIKTSWQDYEKNLIKVLQTTKETYSYECCIFGDIDILEHRKFEENVCNMANVTAYLPLWGKSRIDLINYNVNLPISSKIIVINNKYLSLNILGSDYNKLDFKILESNGIEVCGEVGEFHTVVINAPMFDFSIKLSEGITHRLESVTIIDYMSKNSKLY